MEARGRAYPLAVGVRNDLIEGVSCTGKTSVCDELQRRGHRAIHGDRELAHFGDPKTGEPLDGSAHARWIWPVDTVAALIADRGDAPTFSVAAGGTTPSSSTCSTVSSSSTSTSTPSAGDSTSDRPISGPARRRNVSSSFDCIRRSKTALRTASPSTQRRRRGTSWTRSCTESPRSEPESVVTTRRDRHRGQSPFALADGLDSVSQLLSDVVRPTNTRSS